MNSRFLAIKPLQSVLLALMPAVFFFSCTEDGPADSIQDDAIRFQVPVGFPPPVYSFQNNPLTQEGFELGRALFYDPILSRDSTVSCGSCHQQFVAFAHSEHRFSHGIDDLIGNRNSPGLFNLAWHPEFMWDGGVNHLEVQPLAPITNPIEMDETIQQVVIKLQRNSAYRSRFLKAFGTDSVTTQLTMRAMAQFMGAMVSANARYDRFRNGLLTLDDAELRGLQLFRANCASCHQEPLMSDFTYRNNGISAHFASDPGRSSITQLAADSGKFKVPSLRNVAITPPYMHDGRFVDLQAVLNHYSSGILQSSTLDPSLTPGGMQLTNQEKSDIISFLSTLTDYTFINDRRFAEPR